MKFLDILQKITLVLGTATPAVLYFVTGLGLIKLIGLVILLFYIAQHAFQTFLLLNKSTYASIAAKMLPSLATFPTITTKSALEVVALIAWFMSSSYLMVLLSLVHVTLYIFLALRTRLK